jgi:hypothetical protein
MAARAIVKAVSGAGQQPSNTAVRRAEPIGLLPVVAVICYPFLLDAFHSMVGPVGAHASAGATAAAAAILALVFAVPALGIAIACRSASKPSIRRLAYAGVAAPTLYVFVGVLNYMSKTAYPDELIWCVLWLAAAIWAWLARSEPPASAEPAVARGRVAHGLVAAIVSVFVLFHIANHLFLLTGTDAHTAVMRLGETVYRAPSVEPVLVLLLLFMCASGLYLAWRWSASRSGHDFYRTFQIASGVYVLVYIVGHMNSVFIYARLFLGIPTDWAFAVGAPAGMIHDAWNIRLLPHYALGVFFVLAHLTTGLRGILLAHGVKRKMANHVWGIGAASGAVIATAIIIGMCGVTPI